MKICSHECGSYPCQFGEWKDSHHFFSFGSYTFVDYMVSKNELTAVTSGTVGLYLDCLSSSQVLSVYLPPETHTHTYTHTHTHTCIHTHTHYSLQGYASGVPPLNTVTILGVQGQPTQATLNGDPISGFSFDASTRTLTLSDLKAPIEQKITITWS